jgi:hypothetical protein
MRYINRIVYNDNGWRRPAGVSGETGDSYAAMYGFGHEEWLFRNEWTIDGWRYAFLQGVNNSYPRLCRERQPFDVRLFTLNATKAREYVADICEAECLEPRWAQQAVLAFEEMGWLSAMREEIASVDGDVTALGHAQLAHHILNFRFRVENVRLWAHR